MKNEFAKYGILEEDINRLLNFAHFSDFRVVKKEEFLTTVQVFLEYEILSESIPLLMDDESNYFALYITGILKGKVFHIQHDEASYEPLFYSVSSMLNFFKDSSDFSSILEIPRDKFDYPRLNDKYFDENIKIINSLKSRLNVANSDFYNSQLAFYILALVPYSLIEQEALSFPQK